VNGIRQHGAYQISRKTDGNGVLAGAAGSGGLARGEHGVTEGGRGVAGTAATLSSLVTPRHARAYPSCTENVCLLNIARPLYGGVQTTSRRLPSTGFNLRSAAYRQTKAHLSAATKHRVFAAITRQRGISTIDNAGGIKHIRRRLMARRAADNMLALSDGGGDALA